MPLTERMQTAADLFRKQAEVINQILAEPDSRLDDFTKRFQFKELTDAAALSLRQLQDLLDLSQHTGPNLTLAQLADLLEQHPPDAPVCYDTGETPGRYFAPYRGGICHAALAAYAPDRPQTPPTAGELAREARSAPQMPHTAYKGGEVRLYDHSPVWQADFDQSCGRAVVGIQPDGQGNVTLITAEPAISC